MLRWARRYHLPGSLVIRELIRNYMFFIRAFPTLKVFPYKIVTTDFYKPGQKTFRAGLNAVILSVGFDHIIDILVAPP